MLKNYIFILGFLFCTNTFAQAKKEPRVEFALNCIGDKSSRTKVIFVSLGKSAMFTNFDYNYQLGLTLVKTTSQNYIYAVDFKVTVSGIEPMKDKSMILNRENLSIDYNYYSGGMSGSDPFSCSLDDNPIKAHQLSKEMIITESRRYADQVEKDRKDAEQAKKEQLKRNKI
jgi:hypothetical protein